MSRRQGSLGRAAGATLVVLLVAVVPLALAVPSGAGDDPAAAGQGTGTDGTHLRLDRQTAWVAPGAPFAVQVSVQGDVDPDATIDASVFAATDTRSDFAAEVQGDRLGTRLATSGPEALRSGSGRPTTLLRFATGGAPAAGEGRVELDGPGVYPVEVRLLAGDGTVIDHLVTHLVRLPAANTASAPLRVALVVPLDGGPAVRPNGQDRSDPAGNARVNTLVEALNRVPEVAATLVPTPDTVASLSTIRLARMRRAVADRQVVSSQFVPVDVAAWVANGLSDDLARQTTAGEQALADTLVARPDRRTAVTDTAITADALTQLSDLGADQLVVPDEALAPLDADAFPTTLAQPFEVQDSSGQGQRAVAADSGLAAHVDETGDPTLDAANVLADLATIYYDRPGTTRGVTLALPRVWEPAASFVNTVLAALAPSSVGGEGGGAIVEPVTVDQLFAQVPQATQGGAPLVRTLVPAASPPLGRYPQALPLTRLTTEGFASFAGRQNPVVLSMQRRLLVSGSADLERAQRAAYLDTVSDQIDSAAAAVVAPRTGNITLTSRDGSVPMNISNENLYDVTVRLHFESDKLEFPDGDTLIVHLPRSTVTSKDIAVRSRSSGSFPLRMTVTSPDEILVVSHSRFTVRSTAVSGVGIILSVGAGIFLALWWASHFRRVRRARKLVAADQVPAGL